jgi:hypothetical protein
VQNSESGCDIAGTKGIQKRLYDGYIRHETSWCEVRQRPSGRRDATSSEL